MDYRALCTGLAPLFCWAIGTYKAEHRDTPACLVMCPEVFSRMCGELKERTKDYLFYDAVQGVVYFQDVRLVLDAQCLYPALLSRDNRPHFV